MTEYVEFPAIITKGIDTEVTDDGRRIFKGHITAEIVDRQQEFIFVKEVMAIMKTFMEVNPVMSEIHTNRMVGKVLGYEKSSINGVSSVLITGEVYKHQDITLYDKVWDKIVKGTYRGLSMGGASKEREMIIKDGKQALELRKLELYEIAICPEPANPFAIIEKVNTFAKANNIDEGRLQDLDGRCILKCDQIGMCFEKGTNMDNDNDSDNHQYKCDGGNVCEICGLKKEEHGLEQFDKPTEKDGNDPLPAFDNDKEVKSKADNQNFKPDQQGVDDKEVAKDDKPLTGRAASTRSDDIGQATDSPKKAKDTTSNHTRHPLKIPEIKTPQAKMTPLAKDQQVPEEPKQPEKKVPEPYKKHTLLHMINEYGEDQVRKALEELDTLRYLKDLIRKY